MRLTTSRLLLREFVVEDWRAVRAYQSDPLYTRYHAWEQPAEAEARAFVGRFVSQQQEQPRVKFQFAVALREGFADDAATGLPDTISASGRLIGNCGLRITDASTREGDIGYEFDSRYWGQGYATEAAREMLRLGFEEHGLHRIGAGCVADNAGSARVLEKIGMRREAHLKEKAYFKGRWWDSLLYAILDREWQARQSMPASERAASEQARTH